MKILININKTGFLLLFIIFIVSCKTKETVNFSPSGSSVSLANNLNPAKSDYKKVKVSWFEDLFYKRNAPEKNDFYDKKDLLAAHRTLPIGTVVELTNPENNQTVQVKIVYRGPSVSGREFDLSKKAFKKLENLDKGLIYVEYKIVK